MLENISKFSGKGAYSILTKKLVEATKKMFEKGQASKSKVIADTVTKIVNASKPKTRYRVGLWAKPMVWLRIYLGDRIFDKIVMSQV